MPPIKTKPRVEKRSRSEDSESSLDEDDVCKRPHYVDLMHGPFLRGTCTKCHTVHYKEIELPERQTLQDLESASLRALVRLDNARNDVHETGKNFILAKQTAFHGSHPICEDDVRRCEDHILPPDLRMGA